MRIWEAAEYLVSVLVVTAFCMKDFVSLRSVPKSEERRNNQGECPTPPVNPQQETFRRIPQSSAFGLNRALALRLKWPNRSSGINP